MPLVCTKYVNQMKENKSFFNYYTYALFLKGFIKLDDSEGKKNVKPILITI
jgi:hypothetical protein